MYYKGEHYTQTYCWGVYRKESHNVYILDVDTTHYYRAVPINRFVIKNGYIEGYGNRELLLKSRIRKRIMW